MLHALLVGAGGLHDEFRIARLIGGRRLHLIDILVTGRFFAQYDRFGRERRRGPLFDGFELFRHFGRGAFGLDRRDDFAVRRQYRLCGVFVEARGDDHQLDGIAQLRILARTPDDVRAVYHAVAVLHAGVRLDVFQDGGYLRCFQFVGFGDRDVEQDVFWRP